MNCAETLAMAEHLNALPADRIRHLPPELLEEAVDHLRQARYALVAKAERLIQAEIRVLHCGGYRHVR